MRSFFFGICMCLLVAKCTADEVCLPNNNQVLKVCSGLYEVKK